MFPLMQSFSQVFPLLNYRLLNRFVFKYDFISIEPMGKYMLLSSINITHCTIDRLSSNTLATPVASV